MSTGTIKKVAGPLVIAEGMRDANMFDVVRVSSQRLIGEIIEIHGDEASIQVYEETSGLGPGEPVESMGVPMSVELGPGLITSIYDSPTDKIVYDVSHQSYTHKILTGRRAAFMNADEYDEVSGYSEPSESEHDFFVIGHTSTSVSLASGLAKARDLKG